MFACLHWVSNNSVPQSIQGQPYLPPDGVLPGLNNSQPTPTGAAQDSQQQLNATEPSQSTAVNGVSAAPATNPDLEAANRDYQITLRELAQDLVVKEQQIEMLVKDMPGLNRSQNDQEARMKNLEAEAQTLEAQAKDVDQERELLIKRVEETMMRIRRV